MNYLGRYDGPDDDDGNDVIPPAELSERARAEAERILEADPGSVRPTPQADSARSDPADSSPRVPSASAAVARRADPQGPGASVAQRARDVAKSGQPLGGDLGDLRVLGHWLSLSESGEDTPAAKGAAAALRFYYARELGLPPLAAAELSVIHGRLFVQAKLLRALAAERGYRVIRDPSSDDRVCTAVLVRTRTGEEIGRYTFTIDDAQRAGLIRARSAWITHPARMLWARATKFVLDDYAPDVTMGMQTTDELAEIRALQAEPIGVDVEPIRPEDDDDSIPF